VKPPPFAYVDPATVPDALAILAEQGDDGKILAGGQSLVPLLNMRLAAPRTLIDLNRIPALRFIERRDRNGTPGLAFGAMTRQRTLEDDDALDALPLLREAISWVGHPQIRNRGTIGGSIAHADPAAELPLVFRALDGIATVRSQPGERAIPASDFFSYAFTPALAPDELLAEIWLPLSGPRTGQAFLEVARRHGDFALVAVAASVSLDAGVLAGARIAIGGAAPTPLRATAAESAVNGERPSLDLFREAGRIAAGETEPTDDIHADAAYRREVAGTLVTRALTLAWERVQK
jgi:CO/xanthine dehydrogenase FAD-binding subunit